jgi:hypothetical protein
MREKGYYWVQFEEIGKFIIAEYLGTDWGWQLHGGTEYYEDNDFHFIDNERILFKSL